jgi:hypothetical protein
MPRAAGGNKVIFLYGKSATGYDMQIGPFYGSWCNLYGGHWKHWWQPSRFSFGYDPDYMEDDK